MFSLTTPLNNARCFVLAVLSILLSAWPQAALALDAVTLQLKWRHNFQFAGYYAAQEKAITVMSGWMFLSGKRTPVIIQYKR